MKGKKYMIQPKVLLVEDDPIISKVNGSLLKSLDCDVDFTSSGEDAVNKIARDL